MKQEEVDSRYMMYYSHLCDELGNSPVVCLDGFTGWHVVREMTPEFFKEFNLKTIELNSKGNDYFCLDEDGEVCNRDRCSEWYASNSWTPSNGHLDELKKRDDKAGAFGWYTKTPIMNIDAFRDYLSKRYSEEVASKFDKMKAYLHQIFKYNGNQHKAHRDEFMNLNEEGRKELGEKLFRSPNLPQLFIDGKGFLRDKFYNLITL
jgi:hypothetical protein